MNTTKINFEEVNIPLDCNFSNFIDELGSEFAPTFNDKPMFIIKTKHISPRTKFDYDENGMSAGAHIEYEEEFDTLVMSVFKIQNGWTATINGHFASDYNKHTITHISKFEF